jgi:hypothetical protein
VRGFSVAPDELMDAADAMNGLGERLAASPTIGYQINPGQVGHDGLAVALAELQDASRRGVEILATTAESTARRLSETAEAYRHLDQNSAE